MHTKSEMIQEFQMSILFLVNLNKLFSYASEGQVHEVSLSINSGNCSEIS